MTEPEFDFEAMAESVENSPDPIAPTSAEDALLNSPNAEATRRSVGEFIMSNPGRAKRVRKEKEPRERKAPPARRRGMFVKPLTELYGALAFSLMPFDATCAAAIMRAAPKCAESLDNLAYENEAVRRVIVAMIQTSAIGQVMLAHMPILMAVAMHHVPGMQDKMGTMMGAQTAAEAEAYLRGNDSA